jgi:hypothetical protein
VPRLVGDSAHLLADAVGQYTCISSISVYRDFRATRLREDAAVGTLDDDTMETVTGETYGPLKALCEQAAERAMPGRGCAYAPDSSSVPMTRPIAFPTGPCGWRGVVKCWHPPPRQHRSSLSMSVISRSGCDRWLRSRKPVSTMPPAQWSSCPLVKQLGARSAREYLEDTRGYVVPS